MCVDRCNSIHLKGIQLLTLLCTSVSCFWEMSMVHMYMPKSVFYTFPYCAKTKVCQSHIPAETLLIVCVQLPGAWICACCSDWAVWHSDLGRNMTLLRGVALLSHTRVLLPPASPRRPHTHAASQTKSISLVQGDPWVFFHNLAEENTPRFLRAMKT